MLNQKGLDLTAYLVQDNEIIPRERKSDLNERGMHRDHGLKLSRENDKAEEETW